MLLCIIIYLNLNEIQTDNYVIVNIPPTSYKFPNQIQTTI